MKGKKREGDYSSPKIFIHRIINKTPFFVDKIPITDKKPTGGFLFTQDYAQIVDKIELIFSRCIYGLTGYTTISRGNLSLVKGDSD